MADRIFHFRGGPWNGKVKVRDVEQMPAVIPERSDPNKGYVRGEAASGWSGGESSIRLEGFAYDWDTDLRKVAIPTAEPDDLDEDVD